MRYESSDNGDELKELIEIVQLFIHLKKIIES